ncbi:flagellin N-terminal helical domain-containing protein [Thermaurantiacus sp.]
MFTLTGIRNPVTTAADRMNAVEDRIERLQGQIGRGERFTRPSEDPAGEARAALLARLDARLVSEGRAIDRATARLNLAEVALSEGAALLQRARELALLGANGALSESDRAVLAVEVRGLRAQLLDLGNRRDEAGRYLFAGATDGAPAFAEDEDGRIRFAGWAEGPGAEPAGIRGAAVPVGAQLFGPDDSGAFAAIDRQLEALGETEPALRETAFDDALRLLVESHDRILDATAGVGAALSRLESEAERVASSRLEAARGLAAAKGLDLTAAIAELEALRLTLSASQEIFGRVAGNSLFDRLG